HFIFNTQPSSCFLSFLQPSLSQRSTTHRLMPLISISQSNELYFMSHLGVQCGNTTCPHITIIGMSAEYNYMQRVFCCWGCLNGTNHSSAAKTEKQNDSEINSHS